MQLTAGQLNAPRPNKRKDGRVNTGHKPARVNAAQTEPLIAPILITACKYFNLQRDMTRSDRIPTIIIFYFRLLLRAQIKTNVSGPAAGVGNYMPRRLNGLHSTGRLPAV